MQEADHSDCLHVISAGMQDAGNFSGFSAAILDDCYHMPRDFSQVRYGHCHREANGVAHELARLAKIVTLSTWFDEAPSAITSMLVNDTILILSKGAPRTQLAEI